MAAPPTMANGLPPQGDHSRKPSVTITASGATGYVPNGAAVTPGAQRAGISFGQFDTMGERPSAPGDNSPRSTQASLSAQQGNPRITSPAKSPSPIPQPAHSGGRPPSGFQSSNAPHFGSMNGPENGASPVPVHGHPAHAMTPQSSHLRRQSSQQSDAGNQAHPFTPGGPNHHGRGQFMRNGSNRGSSYGGPGTYPQQQGVSYSPNSNYRQMPNQARPVSGYPPQYPNQQAMAFSGNSPHPPRSPGFPGSQPGTPGMAHQQMAQNQMYGPSYNGGNMGQPSYAQFQQHPGNQQVFGQQPDYSAGYAYYQGGPYPMQPSYLGSGAPPSPSPYRQAPPNAQQQYRQGQFNQNPLPMSRTPSHASTDRPSSSLGPPPQVQTPVSAMRSHTPSQSIGSRVPPPSNQFTIPKRDKSKAIVIKDNSGNILTFDKVSSTPAASTKGPSPGVTGTSTPPPASSGTPVSAHNRSDSKSGKSAAEIKAQFAESVRKTQAADKIKEEETSAAAATAPATAASAASTAATPIDSSAIETPAAETKTEEISSTPSATPAAVPEVDQKASDEGETAAEAGNTKATEEEQKPADAPVAKEKEEAEKLEVEEAKNEDEAAPPAAPATSTEDDEAAKKKADDEEMERMIAEMEAQEKAEEERERAYEAKKKSEVEAKAAAEKASNDEELKRQEREAEALEEKREREREKDRAAPRDDDGSALFASLAKPTLGPGAEGSSGPSEDSAPPPAATNAVPSGKAKPSPLKLDVNKSVEPPQPTPGMRSLQSARMLQVQSESVKYPEGIKSPNPALIQGGKRGGKVYDPVFLMQFQDVFKEKPSVDWEEKLKQTLGDPNDAGPSASQNKTRGPLPPSVRTPSGRGPAPANPPTMGSFGMQAPRASTGRGTTSQQRFEASNPLSGMVKPGFGMGSGVPLSSGRPMSNPMGSGASRVNTNRSKNDSKRYQGKEAEKANKSMPLTANGPVKDLEASKNGWKPLSLQGPPQMAAGLSGHMPPDMVQRKVNSALNKMTPENFERISQQILDISTQSKDEHDGRTLRQIIQLTFEKACDEAHWASMYARFCLRMLDTINPEIKDEGIIGKDGKTISGGGLFRKYLLNRCQEEFEHGWEANLPDKKEGEAEEAAMLSDEYYKAMAAKRKGLGLVQFIGELYKLKMLSIKIMHQCFVRLLDFTGMPEESTIESIVKLMRTVGGTVESEGAHGGQLMDEYFARIDSLYKTEGLPSRVHFMLLDIIDLRKNHWRSKDDQKGPKTIQEIRDEAAAAAAAEAARQQASKNQSRIPSGRGAGYGNNQMPPPDYSRNTITTNDLRKLSERSNTSRNASSGSSRVMGPTSMFARSGSGRQGLGPGMSSLKSSDSRSASKKDESAASPAASSNAFSALAGLQGESSIDPTSPPATKAVPAESKADDA